MKRRLVLSLGKFDRLAIAFAGARLRLAICVGLAPPRLRLAPPRLRLARANRAATPSFLARALPRFGPGQRANDLIIGALCVAK